MAFPKPGPKLLFTNSDSISVSSRGGLVRIRFGKTMADVTSDVAEAFGLEIIQKARESESALGTKWCAMDKS